MTTNYLRPSNATIANRCPASIPRQAKVAPMFPSDSEAMETGRRIHAEIARRLNPVTHTHELTISADEAAVARMCAEFAQAKIPDGATIYPELQLSLPCLDNPCTCDLVAISGSDLIIIDWKTGKIPMEYDAAHDLQLWFYAVGAYRKFAAERTIETVTAYRFHPRVWDERRESMVAFEVGQMGEYESALVGLANRVKRNPDLACPGEMQCAWCRAKTTCPEHLEWVSRMEFPQVSLDSMDMISPEQLAGILAQRDRLSTYNQLMEDAENLARTYLAAGGSLRDSNGNEYTLKEGRRLRSVTDYEAARAMLAEQALPTASLDAASDFSRPKLIAAAAVVWNCSRADAEERLMGVIGDYVEEKRSKPSVVQSAGEPSE